MSPDKLKLLAIRCISSNAALVLVALASIVLTTAFLPPGKSPSTSTDPAADAKEAYQNLMTEIGETPQDRSTATSDPNDFPDSTAALHSQTRVERDLFTPVSPALAVTPGVQSEGGGKSAVRLPALAGVFLDGFSKHAIVAGIPVAMGDIVLGYTVIEIAPTWVIIEKDGVTHKLSLGGTP